MKKLNLALIGASLVPAMAFAEDAATSVAHNYGPASAYIAAGWCMGLAAAVVGFAQSRAAVAALEGIGRNPAASKTLFTPLLLSMALMESLALFGFVISILLVGK